MGAIRMETNGTHIGNLINSEMLGQRYKATAMLPRPTAASNSLNNARIQFEEINTFCHQFYFPNFKYFLWRAIAHVDTY